MAANITCKYCSHSFNPNDFETCPKCKNWSPPQGNNTLMSEYEDDADENQNVEVYEYKHSLNKSIREGGVPIYTTFDIPGKQISESLGMISGVGNAMFTLTGTSARITNRATTKALHELFAEAKRLDADAIVGVNLALDSFAKGWVQQLAVFTGTAVKLKKGAAK